MVNKTYYGKTPLCFSCRPSSSSITKEQEKSTSCSHCHKTFIPSRSYRGKNTACKICRVIHPKNKCSGYGGFIECEGPVRYIPCPYNLDMHDIFIRKFFCPVHEQEAAEDI